MYASTKWRDESGCVCVCEDTCIACCERIHVLRPRTGATSLGACVHERHISKVRVH